MIPLVILEFFKIRIVYEPMNVVVTIQELAFVQEMQFREAAFSTIQDVDDMLQQRRYI
jgi:hypothetical protein